MIELFKKLMEVRDVAHFIHLSKSDTYSKHEALGEFYGSIVELTDQFIEVYQGQFGLVDNYGEFEAVDYSDHIKYLEEFASFVNSQRVNIKEEAQHLNTIIDEVLLLTYKTLYKLKYLK